MASHWQAARLTRRKEGCETVYEHLLILWLESLQNKSSVGTTTQHREASDPNHICTDKECVQFAPQVPENITGLSCKKTSTLSFMWEDVVCTYNIWTRSTQCCLKHYCITHMYLLEKMSQGLCNRANKNATRVLSWKWKGAKEITEQQKQVVCTSSITNSSGEWKPLT